MTRAEWWLLALMLTTSSGVRAQGYRPHTGGGGAQSTSAVTWTSTQTDGGAAFVVPTGQKVCHDGAACGVYTVYDGGTLGVVGAELEAALANSQNVNADTDITPHSVVSQAASGQRAFGPAHDGARTYFGESGNVYCYNNAGEVRCASAWAIQSMSIDTIGSFTSSRYTDVFRVRFFPTGSLGTCNGVAAAGSNPEGAFVVVSGASLGAQSRACLCVSDGGGTPAFTWRNTGCPNTAGTDTTCPACP